MASLVFKRRVEGRRQKENDNRSAGAEEGMVGLGLQRGVQGGRKGHAARRIKLNCLPVVWREVRLLFANATRRLLHGIAHSKALSGLASVSFALLCNVTCE